MEYETSKQIVSIEGIEMTCPSCKSSDVETHAVGRHTMAECIECESSWLVGNEWDVATRATVDRLRGATVDSLERYEDA